MPEPDLSEFEQIDDAAALRRLIGTLQGQLRRAKAKTEDLVDASQRGAREAVLGLGPMPPIPAPKPDRRRKKAEVALWHLTDWQGAKVTTSYNSTVMRERVLRYCDKA